MMQTLAPTELSLTKVYSDTAEIILRHATQEAPTYDKPRLSEVCYLAYEAIKSKHFGTGPFNVQIETDSTGFVLSVKEDG